MALEGTIEWDTRPKQASLFEHLGNRAGLTHVDGAIFVSAINMAVIQSAKLSADRCP